ncbi:hypothetical protein FB446DRAFT_707789 [Lentinula raphanica]|nr:hypothetical protein FB446DRAFT_707789 [Lentinula raphanica]
MTKTPGPNYTTNEDRWMNHVTTGPNTPRGWSCKTENECNAKEWSVNRFVEEVGLLIHYTFFRYSYPRTEPQGVRANDFLGLASWEIQNVPAFLPDPSSLFRLVYLASNAAPFEPGHFRDAVLHLLQAHGLLDSRSDLELIPAGFVDGLASCITGYASGYQSLSRATQATQEALHQQLSDAKTLQTILERERNDAVQHSALVTANCDHFDTKLHLGFRGPV